LADPRIVSYKARGVKIVCAAVAKALKHLALQEALTAAQGGAILVGRGALFRQGSSIQEDDSSRRDERNGAIVPTTMRQARFVGFPDCRALQNV